VRAALALDIGGTKLAAGVVDDTGRVHSFVVAPSHADRGPKRRLERLFDLGREAAEQSGIAWSDIGIVGIGCGGPLDRTRGVLLSPPHLPGWLDVPVTALAENAFDLPAVLENDATAAAAGEYRYGAGAGSQNMVYLTISTGVGGGVVLGGELYRGSTGNGSELGHITVDWRGRECRGCGRQGCLEAYVSGTSICERAREAGLRSTSDDGPTATEVAAAARSGDAVAASVWDITVAALASGVTSIVNVFEPDVLVIGGGVSRTGEQLLAPVRERVREDAMGDAGQLVRIVNSALGERVGVVGAAAIAYDGFGSRDGNG
jgi:glucokinase